MTAATGSWEDRLSALWADIDRHERAFLALALVDLGREREAVAYSLAALSTYLPRYNQSLARYANAIAKTATKQSAL